MMPRPLNYERIMLAKELRLTERLAHWEIGRKLRVSARTIHDWATSYGFAGPLDVPGTMRDPHFDEKLTELWLQGLTTVEIGRRLGVTKNSVIGRAHRIKLPARASPLPSRHGGKRTRPGRRLRAAERRIPLTTFSAGPQETPQMASAPSPEPAEGILADLLRDAPAEKRTITDQPPRLACLYPIGERPMKACGAPVLRYRRASGVVVSRSYCAKHYALAYDGYDPEMPMDMARKIAALRARPKAAA